MSEFANKNVLVTGAAGAVGRVVAERFHEAGANVTGVDMLSRDAPWRTFVADLATLDGARAAVAEASEIDVLANIAGGFAMGDTVAATSDDAWDAMMNINVRTVLNMCRAAVPGMMARGAGKIVNVGARGALRGTAGMAAYVSSKSVVIRLTETLADEVKRHGVNVNCVLPSVIDTPRNRADMPNADWGKWVSPQDIAQVVLFLASPAAAAIHGAAIPVEGLS